jgi:glycopeptide antibiotics resistance protein
MTAQDLPLQQDCRRWSNRILILAVLGIVYLTLFPFEIRPAFPHPYHGSPFFLGDSEKTLRHADFFLNVLLFVPFGFGLATQMRKRGAQRWMTSALLALAAGVCASYTVELLQLYIPGRDSGWEDVISNSMGSAVGALLFAICGGVLLRVASHVGDAVEGWVTPRRTAAILLIYFTVWFYSAVRMQQETRLSNWDPQSSLIVGNDAAGEYPWKGQISSLQIWDRVLPERVIAEISAEKWGKLDGAASVGLLGSYDLSDGPPYQDQRNSLPALEWAPAKPQLPNARAPEINSGAWLRTAVPVENLTRAIVHSNQFTIHIVCAPGMIENGQGRMVSLSQASQNINFHLRQENANVVLFFRNPLSETGSMLAWTVRGVFEAGKTRDIVAMYDGADAFMYVDGKRVGRNYRLGPGATLLHKISLIKPADLDGAAIVYETLLFLPAGILIGLHAGTWSRRKFSAFWMLALGLLAPAMLLEILLVEASGRTWWPRNIVISFLLGIAGVLLVNADRGHHRKAIE